MGTWSSVMAIVLLVVGVVLYFAPSFVAGNRGHHNGGAIFFLNLLAGWTLIGWLVALIWALSSPAPAPEPATPIVQPPPTQPSDDGRRPCPFCAEPILPAATLCRFCRRELPERWAAPTGLAARPDDRIV